MAARQRMMPLLCLLVRLGWQRDPDLWTVRCRDGQGRRARLRVHLTVTGVSIEAPSPGPARLTLWQAGQLRVALRDADLCFGELAGPEERRDFSCPDPARPLQESPPARECVRLLPAATRPTVGQIAQRLARSPVEPKDDPDHADDGPRSSGSARPRSGSSRSWPWSNTS